MEEINNLILQARNIINDLETYVFNNKKAKYFNLKIVTDVMKMQISVIEELAPVAIEDTEYIDGAKKDLNYIISSFTKLKELYQTKEITLVLNEDESFSANISELTEPIKKDENQQLLENLDIDRIETTMPTADINEEAIMQTLSGLENQKIAIESNDSETINIPTIETPNLNSTPNFENDLDVAAINAFLTGNPATNGVRL